MTDPVYSPPQKPPPLRRITGPYGVLLVVAVALLGGLHVATQHVAGAFGYHLNLGPPALILTPQWMAFLQGGAVMLAGLAAGLVALLRVRRGPLGLLIAAAVTGLAGAWPVHYAPDCYVHWALAYGGFQPDSPHHALFARALLVGGAAASALLVLLLAAREGPRRIERTGSHGTARWSSGLSLTGEEGLLLGSGAATRWTPGRHPARWDPRRLRRLAPGRHTNNRRRPSFLRYEGEGHLITVAPTRSGKGVGSVIPNLLTYPGSVVVTDPKGENWAVTARARREVLGQSCVALDPFGQLDAFNLPPSLAAFNPMDLIGAHNLLESAQLLADMLVVPADHTGGEERFWEEEAKALLSGLILHVATAAGEQGETAPHRTLLRVRELLTLPRKEFLALMRAMARSGAAGGLVRRAAARHLQKEHRERSGVVSTAQSQTHFLDSARMGDVLSRSSFDLGALKNGRLSLYLILPAHYLDIYARWLRLMIASALDVLTQSPAVPERRVLFLLDEFANLGRINPVMRAVSLMAGYGAQVWIFLQDLSQLKATYPNRWGTFLANADVLQAFSVGDHDTARFMSDLLGEATVYAHSASENRSRSAGRHTARQESGGWSYAERSRRLLLPDEVRRLPADDQLLFVKGQRPIRARKINYLSDPAFRGLDGRPLFDENPMFRHWSGAPPPETDT